MATKNFLVILKFDERFRRQSHLEVQSNLDQDQMQLRKTTPIFKLFFIGML